MKDVRTGTYRHFKGDRYEVICVAQHTEKDEEYVIYRKRGNSKHWARPVDMFLETVKNETGEEVPRFERE
jgi:hypothetical protein